MRAGGFSRDGGTMAEENNNTPREERPQPPAPPEPDIKAEYDRIRAKHKILKVVTLVLSGLLVIVAVTAFLIYRKISQVAAPLEEVFRAFPSQAVYQPENRTLPASGPSVFSSTSMPASSLGLFSGSLSSSAQPEDLNPEQSEKLLKAINKYSDRPIVKEFLADLKRNPDMAQAFAASKGNNPLQVISLVHNARGMDKLVAKYALRPDFLKVMMEAMNDPEMKPFMQGLPGGMGALPGAAMPVPAAQPQEEVAPAGPSGDGELTLDPSVISGTPQSAPSKPARKVPPPVDTE